MILYADRAFISVNGKRMIDLQSSSLKQNFNARPVPSMTPNRRNRGYVKGNADFDIMVQIAIEQELARPKLEGIDFDQNDIQITYQVGADQYVAKGVFIKDAEDNAGSIGDEAKTTFNFGALDLVDAIGNSVLFDISL